MKNQFTLGLCRNVFQITRCIKVILLFAEFDPSLPPKLNEKVLRDKRKKLKETLDRVLKLYVGYLVVFVYL